MATGLTLLCLLTAGGGMTTTDAVVAYDVTRNIVEHGTIATSGDLIGNPAYRGRDGRYYSPFGIAQSVWNIPFYLIGRAATAIAGSPGNADTVPKAVVALATVPAVALLGWICFELALELGAAPAKAATTVLLLIVGTPLWPYSRFGFNQPLTAMFLWAAILSAVAGARGRESALIASGAFAGLALLTRHEMLGAAVILGAFVAATGTARSKSLMMFAIGLMPFVAIWALLNWWRFGNPLESGYLADRVPGYGGSILEGGLGLLFSPYSSLLLYCPVVLLGAAGLRALGRRNVPAMVLFTTICVTYFALYASLGNWMGGRSYGPRYLVPFLPALVMPLAFWTPSARTRAVAFAIVVLSIAIQIPGVLVDYSKVRMARATAGETVAQDMRWSGMPLWLNAQAAASSAPQVVQHLATPESAPRLKLDELRRATGFDFWWLHLFYLGAIGRFAALSIASGLAAGSALAIRHSLTLASRMPLAASRI
jgi:hypothetical protein